MTEQRTEEQISEMLKREYLLEEGEFAFKTEISTLEGLPNGPLRRRTKSLWLKQRMNFLAHWMEFTQADGEERISVNGAIIRGAEMENFGTSPFVRQQLSHCPVLANISKERHELLHKKLESLEKEAAEFREKVRKLQRKNRKLKYSPGNVGALKAEQHFRSLETEKLDM
ncbi:hypothetical protein MEL_081 [Melbournevirus]|nr:hypothetical protein MEL_081 [Melbournevirus]AIT54694.1 hypothetical protein MEL_081 [Melbournevirus]